MLKQAHLFIKGDVIGVGFRAWTKIQAKINHISGWVKNSYEHPDKFGPGGGVETLIQGEEDNVTTMVELLKKGPPIARVDDTEVYFQDPKEIFDGFELKK